MTSGDTSIFHELTDSHLLHRSLKVAPHVVERAEGAYLYLQDGKRILDGCGGAAVVSIGHAVPEVISALTQQLQTVSYVHTSDYTTIVSESLANFLLENYKDKLAKVYFVNSGSEANEAAVKLAIQYFFEQGKANKVHFIARKQSYHGNCLAGISLSGHVARRLPYENIISDKFHHVSPANEFRDKLKNETTDEYVTRLADELESKILEIGAENVAGFFAETIVGATTGCTPAPKGYFKAIHKVCEKYDVLLLLDEVMCGSGRTGTFFAWEQEGIVPDITTSGKAISGGYCPLSAVYFKQKFVDVLGTGSTSFNNGHTYQSFPLSCAAGKAVQSIIQRDNLLDNVKAMGDYLGRSLVEKLMNFSIVGDIRGRGLFWGIEFVKDKESKEPIDPSIRIGYQIQQAVWRNGVALYPGFGTVDGLSGDHILISPPFNVTEEQIDTIIEKTAIAIKEIQNLYFK